MTSWIQRSFAGGEIAPALFGRADQTKYVTGLKTCRNFLVQRFGGVTNRPGTQFICETKISGQVRLIKFVFNSSQTYVLEFGNLYMRVIKNGVRLGAPYEIVTPYATADLRTLQFVQSADVVTIAHPNYQPRELRRLADTNWTLTALTTEPSIAAPTGVAASGAPGPTYSYVVTAAKAETYEESLPSAAATTNHTTPTITWTAVSGAAEYYVYKALNGVYGFIGTAIGTSFADTGLTPIMTDTPPQPRALFAASGDYPQCVNYTQQRLCFAATLNAPEKVWMSQTGNFKNFSYRSPIQADDAVTFTLAGRQVNEVRHLVEIDRLLVLTGGGEWLVQGDQDGLLSPTTLNLKQIGYSGASTVPPVIIGNSALFIQARGSVVRDLKFDISADGYQGRDLTVYAPHLFDGYTLVAMDYAQVPHSVVWGVRDDGALLGLTYLREHEIWGWHRHDTGDGDSFEDVCVVPEGNEDAAYTVVRRTIAGSTKRYIERFATRRVESVATDAKFLDSHLTYDGTNLGATTLTISGGTTWAYTEDFTLTASASQFIAGDVGNIYRLQIGTETLDCRVITYTSGTVVTVQAVRDVPVAFRGVATASWARCADDISGLGHLEGREVAILADGLVHPPRTVTGGAITLQRPYAVVHVGLPITADLELLDLEAIQGETLLDKRKRINRVVALVQETRAFLAGPDASNLREAKLRAGEPYAAPITPVTGTTEVLLNGTWDDSGRVFIRNSDPLPVTVLAVIRQGLVS